MSNLIPQPCGVSKVVNWPSFSRKIFFRHDPKAGGLPTETVELPGRSPLGPHQIIAMAGGK
jgi:hypothetical protein